MQYQFQFRKKVFAAVPQGSNDRARLLHLYINELTLFVTDTFWSDYKDDNNVYIVGTPAPLIKGRGRGRTFQKLRLEGGTKNFARKGKEGGNPEKEGWCRN